MSYKDVAKKKEYFENRKHRMRESGICTYCCKNEAKGGSTCTTCRDKLRARVAEVRNLRRRILNRYKMMHGCQQCGYKKHPVALEFHHINGDKYGDLARVVDFSAKRFIHEIMKCIVLCANCHRILHADNAGVV